MKPCSCLFVRRPTGWLINYLRVRNSRNWLRNRNHRFYHQDCRPVRKIFVIERQLRWRRRGGSVISPRCLTRTFIKSINTRRVQQDRRRRRRQRSTFPIWFHAFHRLPHVRRPLLGNREKTTSSWRVWRKQCLRRRVMVPRGKVIPLSFQFHQLSSIEFDLARRWSYRDGCWFGLVPLVATAARGFLIRDTGALCLLVHLWWKHEIEAHSNPLIE